MQSTSEERRDVARKLRDDLPVARNIQEGYVAIMQTIGVRPCLLMTEGQSDRFDKTAYEEGAASLAAYIDPTCHVVGTISYDWSNGSTVYEHELSCGHTCRTAWQNPPAFCDKCGARVVDE